MELGRGKLLRTGLNALYQAIHPIHGLAWTDGNQVVLTDLHLHGGEAKFGDSAVIGQFEHVYRVSWAPPGTADTPALLAVQHKKHVIVWQLCPSTTETSKWLMSQTCEIRQSLPVLPQGCVWHPKSAALTVLTAQDVSVFHNVHWDSSQVKVDISTQGLIHCACWTPDGQRLVVAVGSSVHSYIWDSAQKTLHRCSFCPVFDVASYVRSIGATVDSQVAIATELPLDKICGLNASGTFDVPPSSEGTCLYTLPVIDEVSSETNSETPVSPFSSSFSDPLDLTHIHFDGSKSEASSLICLRKKDYLTGTGLDSSHLVLLTFEKEVTQNRKVTIPGILVPDLMAFNLKAQVVAVASNTCNIIFIYSVVPSFMPNIQQIQLESNERPKGICFLTDKLLLILIGKQKSTDSAFLLSSKSDQYMIRLIVREVMLEEGSPVTPSENQSGHSAFSTLLNKANRKKLIESLSPDFCHQNGGILLTANSSSQSGRPGRTLIQEIRSPPSSICDGSTALETLDAGPVNQSVTLPGPSGTPDHNSTAGPPNLQVENENYQLSKILEILSRNLIEVQQRLSELTDFLHNGKKSSPVYPLSQNVPYVHITCQKSYFLGPVVEKRAVLLCNGKLRLSTVQQTFGLSLIEMLHDSHWILLCADSEGFIPLTFTATQEIVIRDGRSNDFRGPVS
ncbi:WD repeat and coiled-coil-containing protein isoform X1 [Sagmatias obliquidens]|uniref:WD repeat and coiled-coil-containing protein isoform X1 n=1 Tax=Sagmatias obliquidens TaxID=3371155 RepID=UPI000F444D9F|nr:WD repeat and coiled-coil-containing protein isoform X1 [Lagenorhynchus obliquidens]XP_026969520.1 WD repeat and coiled-coil-containing protein isoform X1 [Lagenorhynchus obliquidens]